MHAGGRRRNSHTSKKCLRQDSGYLTFSTASLPITGFPANCSGAMKLELSAVQMEAHANSLGWLCQIMMQTEKTIPRYAAASVGLYLGGLAETALRHRGRAAWTREKSAGTGLRSLHGEKNEHLSA